MGWFENYKIEFKIKVNITERCKLNLKILIVWEYFDSQ